MQSSNANGVVPNPISGLLLCPFSAIFDFVSCAEARTCPNVSCTNFPHYWQDARVVLNQSMLAQD